MLSPPGLPSRPQYGDHKNARDSVLTFAAIYYPDTGMQSFDSDSLGALMDYERADESSVSHEDFIARRNLGRKDGRPPKERPSSPEPFALLGGRQRHFIGICSSKVYENYSTTESDEIRSYASIPIESILFSDFEGSETKASPYLEDDSYAPQHPVSVPITPSANSVFTFAALHDPKRLSGLQDAKFLCVPQAFKHDDNETDAFATPKAELEEVQELMYFPASSRTPNTYRDAIPSSTLNGLKGRWQGLPYYEDDEGFYETVQPNDCTNLPSRFSVTTTSTSRYVEVDEGVMPSPGPTAVFMGRKPALPSKPSFLSCSRQRKPSLPHDPETPRLPPVSGEGRHHQALQTRLSQVFRQRLSKKNRPENINTRWVMVDVECVVTERVFDV
ncbi:hypothetical protein BKA70DRAFT_478527 [Coprinopsis sp. MPI-PUGE-AT-0042]|nr:hypothetical protein BKA70DRAFT_478527 [Coprinopsis sp. MPI-PUGE-AT-0042]